MRIRLVSLLSIVYAAAALSSCDGPTAVDRTLSPSFANSVDPNAPANLTATPVVPAQINLAWTAKSHNETGFQIFRSNGGSTGFSLLVTTSANVTTYADVSLQPVNEHCYKVQGISKTRILGVTGTACAKPPVTPPAASNASATAQGTTVSIVWTDNSVIESGFRIEVAPSIAGEWTTSGAFVAADITSAQRSATLGTSACFRIVAFNEFGDGAASNAACIIPLAAPSLTATGEGQYDREIALSWSSVAGAYWYEISRSAAGEGWQVINTLYAYTTAYLDQNLTPGSVYSYRVRATGQGSFSDYSNIASATALAGHTRGPAWVEVWASGGTTVDVYWEVPQAYWDGASSITGWRIQRSTYPFTSWTTVVETTIQPYEWNYWYYGYYGDSGLTPDEMVCYQVIALSGSLESDPTSGDYSCATPTDYWGGGAENASAGVRGINSLLNSQTPLLNFGAAKSALARPHGAVPPARKKQNLDAGRARR